MSYKTKADLSTNTTTAIGGEGNPTSVEGYYLGHKKVDSDFGEAKLHIFQTADGNIGVWGKTHLDQLLTSDHVGQMCLVTFAGMRPPSKKGRRPSYTYTLQYDPENTIDVGTPSNSVASAVEDLSSEEADYSADDAEPMDEVAPSRAVAPAKPLSTPSAETRAQVSALLKGRAQVRS